MPIKTHKIRLYPNAEMQAVLLELMDYGRYCWNTALETWNAMYQVSVLMADKGQQPNEHKVRDELVRDKQEWQYAYSARVLQQAVHRLHLAWQNFFNPNMPNAGKPKFHSKRSPKQSFTTDRAKVVGQTLCLDHPHSAQHRFTNIPMAETLRFTGEIKTVTITKRGSKFYASITVEVPDKSFTFLNSWDIVGVDLNVGHINWNNEATATYTERMAQLQERIKHYQKQSNRKRRANPHHYYSKNYQRTRAKLNAAHQHINDLQQDLINKLGHHLVTNYDVICIEDLDVKQMKMHKGMAKNIQRSFFRRFRTALTYMAAWAGKTLIVAKRWFPIHPAVFPLWLREDQRKLWGQDDPEWGQHLS